jgi:uncharacterized Zn finger protein
VQMGRVPEAVAVSLQQLETPDQALQAGQALLGRGATAEALRVAEHGLGLPGEHAGLALWLRDQAEAAGQTELAMAGAQALFEERPSLADYQVIERLAGKRWTELKKEILERVRRMKSFYPRPQIEILLYEGQVEDAMALVRPDGNYALVALVADAAVRSHPEWVIRASRVQAEPFMDQGKSEHYHHAAEWLEKARTAYLASGREAEWQQYLDELLQKHQRKRALVPRLQRLR